MDLPAFHEALKADEALALRFTESPETVLTEMGVDTSQVVMSSLPADGTLTYSGELSADDLDHVAGGMAKAGGIGGKEEEDGKVKASICIGVGAGVCLSIGKELPDGGGGGGGGGGHWETGCCFVDGTPILMADGTSKPIEEVQFGDQVMSYDFDQGITVPRTVCLRDNPVRDNVVDLRLSDGGTIASTTDHPYWVEGKGWCSVDPEMTLSHYDIFNDNGIDVLQLQAGDQLWLSKQWQQERAAGAEASTGSVSVVTVSLESITERAYEPTSLWILRVGDYGVNWRAAQSLYDAGLRWGDLTTYHEAMGKMNSRERNPHNHNFFAGGVLVHNK